MNLPISKLSKQTRFLHVIVALSMIAMLAVGIYMEENEAWGLYPIHKSIGVIVLVVALIRVSIRVSEGWPEEIVKVSKGQAFLARLIHWILITSTLLFPISGIMMSGAGGNGVAVFGLELMASNYDPVTQKAVVVNEFIAGLGHQIHGAIVWVVIGAIVLHIAGALKHHFVDKDETLTRMF